MIPIGLSWIDGAFFLLVLLFIWGGIQRGFAKQVAQVITFLTFGAALFFVYPTIYSYAGRLFREVNETYRMWLILAGLGVLAVLFFLLMSRLTAKLIKTQVSEQSDRTYGGILGLFRGVLIGLFILIFLVILGPPETFDTVCAKSKAGKLVCYQLVPRIQPHVTRAVLREQIHSFRKALNQREEAVDVEHY